jgi:hypothetical protein
VTRFQKRGLEGRVVYDFAQVKLFVENRAAESPGVNKDGIVVYAEDEV